MTELTTERLERKIKNCIEIEDVQVMLPLSAAEELLAFREAAKNPVAIIENSEQKIVGWIFEDELPENYPYDAMFAHSKVDVVRMFPVYAPSAAQPVSKPYKLKDAVEDIRNSGVEIDADKIKAERDALNSPVIPDGWVMVPQQIFLDASDIESICSQCGDGHKRGYGDFTDGLLWVGDIRRDDGTIMHGLHISSSDYTEEGGLTLAEFAAPAQESE